MNYYIDVIIKPDAEMRLNVLLNIFYTKLHKALCDLHTTSIGVSFPGYKVTLGNILRIHGDQSALNELQSKDWIGGMSGYCEMSDVTPIPSDVQYRTVARKQTTMSNAKLNRLQKRGSITQEEVKAYKAKLFTKGLDNPYVELESGSNCYRHRRYLEFGLLQDSPVVGDFDQFGLSRTATIPWF